MYIVTLSDTHDKHDSIIVPDGDVVVHAGDCSPRGKLKDIISFVDWYAELPHKHKVMIAGNHDFYFQGEDSAQTNVLPGQTLREYIASKGIHYLQDSEVVIEGKKFYGAPWQPWFGGWAFNLVSVEERREKWDMIPDDTDVLITHGPPFGVLDVCLNNQKSAGCNELLKAVERVKPKLHVFGHIHEGYGSTTQDNIIFANASNCTLWYEPKNKPMIFSIH